MTYTVYGLRLRDEREVRYVGQTGDSPVHRLRFLLSEARAMPSPTLFAEWLTANAGKLEAFEIARAGSREEVRRKEREAVEMCLLLGQRLFNRQLVPASKRTPLRLKRVNPWQPKDAAA